MHSLYIYSFSQNPVIQCFARNGYEFLCGLEKMFNGGRGHLSRGSVILMGHPRTNPEGSNFAALEACTLPERVSNRLDTAQSDSVNCKFMAARVESRGRRKECRHRTSSLIDKLRINRGRLVCKNVLLGVANLSSILIYHLLIIIRF